MENIGMSRKSANTPRKVYLAGPMSGYPDWNLEKFHEIEKKWRTAGWVVYSPAALHVAVGHVIYGDAEVRQAIRLDLVCIEHAWCVALLPGWQHSIGATLELAYAQFLGLPVYDAESMERIYPSEKPWGELASIYNSAM